MLASIIALLGTVLTTSDSPLVCPVGGTPTLDGVVNDDEWSGAQRIERVGQTILIMHDGERLHIGLRAAIAGAITTVCIQDGDRVRVLHASAALGEATYQRDGDGWAVETTPAEWARFGRDAAAWPGLQQAFFDAHEWTGSHARMGDDLDTEISIALDAVRNDRGESLPIAVVLYEAARDPADCRVLISMPAVLSDDTQSRGVNAAFWPEAASFATESWARIELAE